MARYFLPPLTSIARAIRGWPSSPNERPQYWQANPRSGIDFVSLFAVSHGAWLRGSVSNQLLALDGSGSTLDPGGGITTPDDTDRHIDVPDPAFGTGDFTIVCDLKVAGETGYGQILGADPAGATYNPAIYADVNDNNNRKLGLWWAGSSPDVAHGSNYNISLGYRFRFAVVRRGNTVEWYVDGNDEGTNSLGATTTWNMGAEGLRMFHGDDAAYGTVYGLALIRGAVTPGLAREATRDFNALLEPADQSPVPIGQAEVAAGQYWIPASTPIARYLRSWPSSPNVKPTIPVTPVPGLKIFSAGFGNGQNIFAGGSWTPHAVEVDANHGQGEAYNTHVTEVSSTEQFYPDDSIDFVSFVIFKTTAPANQQCFIYQSNGTGAGYDGYGSGFGSGGGTFQERHAHLISSKFGWTVQHDDAQSTKRVDGATTIVANRIYVGAVRARSDGQIRVYLDGEIDGTATNGAGLVTPEGTGSYHVMHKPAGYGARDLDGTIYAWATIRGTLSDAEIKKISKDFYRELFQPADQSPISIGTTVAGGGPTGYTITANLAAVLQQQDILKTASLAAALQRQDNTLTASLAAALQQSGALSASMAAALQQQDNTVTADLNAALQKAYTSVLNLDAVLISAGTNFITADLTAVLQAHQQITASLNSVLVAIQTNTISANLAAALQEQDKTITSSLAAHLINEAQTVQAFLSAILQGTLEITANLNCVIRTEDGWVTLGGASTIWTDVPDSSSTWVTI